MNPEPDPENDLVTDFLSLRDYEERARAVLPHAAFEYIASGAADEHTLGWNEEAWAKIRLGPRVLVDVTRLDTRVTLFGDTLPFPILLAPTAYHRMIHPDGEREVARGAGEAGATFVVSSSATTSVEEIAQVATGPLWFQLYFWQDRGFTRELVGRAESAGCRALCVTVDTPTLGARDRQRRAKFALPPGMETPHTPPLALRPDPTRDRAVTWADVEWLRSFTRIPLLLKGVLDPDDAERAINEGAEGIIVSNHGARNLDTLPPTADALGPVAARVNGRVPVLVDGGIRRGTDALKALALGANAVLIGRPYLYALGVGGAAGVRHVVEILRSEFDMALALTGRPCVANVDRSVLWDGQAA